MSALLWSKAAAPVWAMVCGLPSPKREHRHIWMLKAYIDDSGKSDDEPMFVLAGLIAPAEKWAAFSDKWAAKLGEHPRLDYFKMREAWALRGQFERFSEPQRDKRLEGLVAIINEHADFFAACMIMKADWKEVLKGRIAKTLDSPFYHAYCWVSIATFTHMDRNSVNDTVDFVFDKDNETIYREILDWWLRTRETAPQWIKERLGNDPRMDDDKKVLPLQAADLIAWIASKRGTSGAPRDFASRWAKSLNVAGCETTWDRQMIEELLQSYIEATHGLGKYEDGAARSERLNKLFGPRR